MSGRTLYCLGEAWLELESPASLSSAETFRPRVGGSAAALALAYAALGGRAALLGQLVEDAFGHRIADALADAGVDVCRLCFTSAPPRPSSSGAAAGRCPAAPARPTCSILPGSWERAGPQTPGRWPFPAPAS